MILRTRTTLAAVALSLTSLLSVDTYAQVSKGEFVKQAEKQIAFITSTPAASTSRCAIAGVRFSANAYVNYVGNAESQFELGDRIVGINGRALDSGTGDAVVAELSRLKPGQQIQVTVLRQGKRVEAASTCVDALPMYSALLDAYRAIATKRFDDCLDRIPALYATWGPGVALQHLQSHCMLYAKTVSASDWPRLLYENNRLWIEEARWDPGEFENARGIVLSNESYFRRNGQGRLFEELESQLRAVSQTGTASAASTRTPQITSARLATGTGFFVSDTGLFITSAHVVSGATRIVAHTSDGKSLESKVVALSEATDIALLRAPTRPSAYLSLSEARSAKVGMDVFTYGFPITAMLGTEPKFTDGTISALSGLGNEQSFLQISVPVQPGNSGGPLVDSRGYVVGVIAAQAAVLPFLKGTGTLPQNVNWAVKSEYASLLAELPPRQPPLKSRQEAISLVRGALVYIEASGPN